MPTHKNRKYKKNKTYKKRTNTPSIKNLHKGFKLYGAKSYNPKSMFEYQEKKKKQYNNNCVKDSFSWFGNYDVAYKYSLKDKKSTIYEFKTKMPTNLVNLNMKNKDYFKKLFTNTDKELKPLIHIKKNEIENIHYDHKYLNMSIKEQAYYEFCFCFGYITLTEQYDFLGLIKYLIIEKMIDMTRRDGGSLLGKIDLRLAYYKVNHIFSHDKDNTMYNRMSIYSLDVNSISNLCSILPKYIAGAHYGHHASYWYPSIINKTDLEEFIIFNPSKTLMWYK